MNVDYILAQNTSRLLGCKFTVGLVMRGCAPFYYRNEQDGSQILAMIPIVALTFYSWRDWAVAIEYFGIFVYARVTL